MRLRASGRSPGRRREGRRSCVDGKRRRRERDRRQLGLAIALRTSRIDQRAEHRDDDRGDEPWAWPKPICVASQPPSTPPRMPTTTFGRQPRAVLPPTQRARDRARDEADDDPADESMFSMRRSIPQVAQAARHRGQDRLADDAAATTASGWVWCAACRAPGDDHDAAIGEPRRRGPRSRSGTARQAVAAQELEDRLADCPERVERPGAVGIALRLASSRTIVGAAATRRGQTGLAR